MKFNINDKVRVKLTDRGRRVHKDNFWNLMGDKYKYEPPEEVDGWSEWQMWELMHEFGASCYNGGAVPFETEIEILLPPQTASEIADVLVATGMG